jgi:hypothetical protein
MIYIVYILSLIKEFVNILIKNRKK